MEEVDKGCPMTGMGVSGLVSLLVPAYPGSPRQRAIKRLCVFVAGDIISAEVFLHNLTFAIVKTAHTTDHLTRQTPG